MERISQRRYAARIGVSHVYINRLVRAGKLPVDADGQIDPEEADRMLAALREPARPSRRAVHRDDGGLPAGKRATKPHATAQGEIVTGSPERGDLPTLLLKTRIKSEAERGKLLELKAKVEAGRYVDADDVRVAAFNKGRLVRENLLNISGRLAPLVAAEGDERRCFELMDGEIRRALVELTGGPSDE